MFSITSLCILLYVYRLFWKLNITYNLNYSTITNWIWSFWNKPGICSPYLLFSSSHEFQISGHISVWFIETDLFQVGWVFLGPLKPVMEVFCVSTYCFLGITISVVSYLSSTSFLLWIWPLLSSRLQESAPVLKP